MATIFDLIEVTGIFQHTTYSEANGNLLGVVDGAVSTEFDDGEFDEGDFFTLGGQTYRIDLIQEPSSSGRFTTGDGTDLSFNPQSESNLDVIFLTVSNGSEVRHFIIPNDSYGDLNFTEIRTGEITDVAGSDAALVSTQDNSVSAVCFCAGTGIRRGDGSETPVETLKVGDRVATLDQGVQTVRWVGRRPLSVPTLLRYPKLRPILIPAGSLGPGIPTRDLHVSPQHRILVRSRIAQRMFDTDEVLVAAKQLVGVNGIRTDLSAWNVTYLHVLLETHAILIANGAPCESLFLGQESRKALGAEAREEIELIFDRPLNGLQGQHTARDVVSGRRAKRLIARHQKNNKAILQGFHS